MIWSPFLVFSEGTSYKATNVIHKTIRIIYTAFLLKQSLFMLVKIKRFGRLSEL